MFSAASAAPAHEQSDVSALHSYAPLWSKMHDADLGEGSTGGREWHLDYAALRPLVLPYATQAVEAEDFPRPLVLDVGCGSSAFSLDLLADAPNCRLLLLDVVPSLADALRSRYAGDERVEIAVDDCRVLATVADDSATVVIDKGTLDALDTPEERQACFRAMARKLRHPHGLLVSVSFATATRLIFLRREAAVVNLQLRFRLLPAGRELRLVALVSRVFGEIPDTADEHTKEQLSMLLYKGPLRSEPFVHFEHPGLPAGTQIILEQVIEQAKKSDDDATGNLVWPAAHAFSAHLCAHPELVRDRRVVELGAGTGLAGFVAAALGAEEVVLTDLAETAVLAQRNVARNAAVTGGRVRTAELRWGAAEADALLADCGLQAFDVVIGCEVVYGHDAGTSAALVESMARLVGVRGVCLLVYEFRGGLIEDMEFFDRAEEVFDVETLSLGEYGYGIPKGIDDGDSDLWRMLYIYRPRTVDA